MKSGDPNIQGGPAFPVSIPGCGDNGWCGMTLRDYFAAQALIGHCASVPGSHHHPENAAAECYAYADAMLRARNKTT